MFATQSSSPLIQEWEEGETEEGEGGELLVWGFGGGVLEAAVRATVSIFSYLCIQ